jgi:hypothetical protein
MKFPKRHTWLAAFSVTTLLLSVLLLGQILFWLLYPYPMVTYDHKPFHIVESPKAAYQGGHLSYEYAYTKPRQYTTTVTKQFVDGIVFQSESLVTLRPIGHAHVVSEIPVPYTLPPGRYKLRITATYKLNPIRSVTQISETEQFLVMESPE